MADVTILLPAQDDARASSPQDWHEFDESEAFGGQPDDVHADAPRPYRPNELTADYVFSLPEEGVGKKPYPWDDRAWQKEWFWTIGSISDREALFWFYALTHPDRMTDTRARFEAPRSLRRLRRADLEAFDADVAAARLGAWLDLFLHDREPRHAYLFAYLGRMLRELLPAHELLDAIARVVPPQAQKDYFIHLIEPDAGPARDALHTRARALLSEISYESQHDVFTGIRLLERVSLPDQVERLIAEAAALPDAHGVMLRQALMLAHDTQVFARWLNHLGDRITLSPEHIPQIVWRAGKEGIGTLMEIVLARPSSFHIKVIKDLVRIHTPQATRGFVSLIASHSPVMSMARAWIVEEGARVGPALIEIALKPSKRAHVALSLLEELRDRGHAQALDRLVRARPERDLQRLGSLLLEDYDGGVVGGVIVQIDAPLERDQLEGDLLELCRVTPCESISTLAPSHLFPPLRRASDGRVLPQRVTLGAITRAITHKDSNAGRHEVASLKECIDAESLEQLWIFCLDRFEEAGEPVRLFGVVWASALHGSETLMGRLRPYAGRWKGRRDLPKLRRLCALYATIGTPEALMRLHTLSHKTRAPSIKQLATKLLGDVAARRGLTREELQDALVPSCGLDAQGQRIFCYGPRSFSFVLDRDLAPRLIDDEGKLRGGLPAARKSDDAHQVAEAKQQWAIFSKAIKSTLRAQSIRLEHAMIGARRWRAASWRELFADHPLMRVLAARLVWGSFPFMSNEPDQTFRLNEEGELVDAHDEEITLADEARVGIVYPLYLSEPERQQWGEHLADYEIVPPFAQIDRALYEPDPSWDAHLIEWSEDHEIEAASLRGRLEARGWHLVDASRAGASLLRRDLSAHDVAACVAVEPGLSRAWSRDDPPQSIRSLRFESLDGPGDVSSALPIARVHAVAMSEVLADLYGLMHRAQ